MKLTSIVAAIFALSVPTITQAVPTVTFTLELNPIGTYELFATTSLFDNFGLAGFDVTLTGAILTADHRTPNGINLLSGNPAGFTLLRSPDNDTNGEGFNIGAAQNTVDPTPHLIDGYGQTAGNIATQVPNYFSIGSADTVYAAPFLIAQGTYNPLGTTPGFGQIFESLANVFVANNSPNVVAADVTTTIVAVPEPSTGVLFLIGVLATAAGRRRSTPAKPAKVTVRPQFIEPRDREFSGLLVVRGLLPAFWFLNQFSTFHPHRVTTMKTRLTRRLYLVTILAVGTLSARADLVADWNTVALQAIKTDRTPPPKSSRALAILHVAIYDAVNGLTRTHEPYLVSGRVPRIASSEAAVLATARAVLVQVFPAQQTTFDTAYGTAIAAIPDGLARKAGIAWGERVAKEVLAARAGDGSDAIVPYTPGTAPGDWQPTPPAFAPALLPGWGQVTPFAMRTGSQFRPPPAPKLDSAVWAYDFNLVKELGSVDSTKRTADQTAIARFWADGPGTVTPPGHWNVIARELAIAQGNTLAENARLFALLNIALADAAISCWDCKYADNFWRPVTAIRAGDTDSNPATEADPTWTPLITTPPFPEYTSGHSTFSAAAAIVLTAFFGSDSIAFSTTSEDLPGVTRSFGSFWEAATEAALSRLFGGIHYPAGNTQGSQAGARLGYYVTEHFLRERQGRSPWRHGGGPWWQD